MHYVITANYNTVVPILQTGSARSGDLSKVTARTVAMPRFRREGFVLGLSPETKLLPVPGRARAPRSAPWTRSPPPPAARIHRCAPESPARPPCARPLPAAARSAPGPDRSSRGPAPRSRGSSGPPGPVDPAPHCSGSRSPRRMRAQARLGRPWQAPGGPESSVGGGRTRGGVPGDFSAGPRQRARAGALRPPRETAETPAAAATPVT